MRRVPSPRDWAEAAVLLGGFLVVSAPIALSAGLITIEDGLAVAWPSFAIVALVAIVLPALGEEFLFRGVMRHWLGDAAALALFVAWHPVQHWLGLPMAQAVFLRWEFLLIAALLGLACTISVKRSGSLWCAIAIHWAVVVGWKAVAG